MFSVFVLWQGCVQPGLPVNEPSLVNTTVAPTLAASASSEAPTQAKPRTLAQARVQYREKQRPRALDIDPNTVPSCPKQLDIDATIGDDTCYCAPDRPTGGSIWGDLLYTSDSDPCKAARHAGVIPETGGVIQVVHVEGCTEYPSATRNGIVSSPWNMWRASFYFADLGETRCTGSTLASSNRCPTTFGNFPLTNLAAGCDCDASTMQGAVWGDNPYTADSNPCTAAVHAGIISMSGGHIEPQPLGGCNRYPGSSSNGVTTSTWAAYSASFYFSPPGGPSCKP